MTSCGLLFPLIREIVNSFFKFFTDGEVRNGFFRGIAEDDQQPQGLARDRLDDPQVGGFHTYDMTFGFLPTSSRRSGQAVSFPAIVHELQFKAVTLEGGKETADDGAVVGFHLTPPSLLATAQANSKVA